MAKIRKNKTEQVRYTEDIDLAWTVHTCIQRFIVHLVVEHKGQYHSQVQTKTGYIYSVHENDLQLLGTHWIMDW